MLGHLMCQCSDIGKIAKRQPYTVRRTNESAAHRPLVRQLQVVIGDDGRDVDWGELPEMLARMSAPPDGLPIYRILTGPMTRHSAAGSAMR
jgi:hypothetical protein